MWIVCKAGDLWNIKAYFLWKRKQQHILERLLLLFLLGAWRVKLNRNCNIGRANRRSAFDAHADSGRREQIAHAWSLIRTFLFRWQNIEEYIITDETGHAQDNLNLRLWKMLKYAFSFDKTLLELQ